MKQRSNTERRLLPVLALTCLLSACALPGLMRFEGSWVALEDGVTREEARLAVTAVIDHVGDQDIRGRKISVGAWRYDDLTEPLNERCYYSVNVDSWSGFVGRSFCVTVDNSDGQLEVLDEIEWVTTQRKPDRAERSESHLRQRLLTQHAFE